jgi:endo-1,4-beta-xylanase
VRHERFGSGWNAGDSQQPAGTVTSFDNGVLTITLNDGSTVSGAVTNDTELECTAPSSSTQGDEGNDNGDNGQNSGDDNSGDDNGGQNSGDDNGSGGGDNPTASGDDGDNGSAQSGDDDGGNDDQGDGGQMCSTSSLTPGASVAEANLEVTSAGAVWQKVELITSS